MGSNLTPQELRNQIELKRTELDELVEKQRSIEMENRRIKSEQTRQSIEDMINSRREETRIRLDSRLNKIENKIQEVKTDLGEN
jgi:hypothetical protein